MPHDTRRYAGAALVALALAGTGVALTPTPCAACSPPEAPLERLDLELQEVEVDGSVVAPGPGYQGVETTLEAQPGGGMTLFLTRDGQVASLGFIR